MVWFSFNFEDLRSVYWPLCEVYSFLHYTSNIVYTILYDHYFLLLSSLDANYDDQGTVETTTLNKNWLHCFVPHCNEDSRYHDKLSLHRFPKDYALRNQWIIKIRRNEGPYFTITNNIRVCSRHFLESNYRPPTPTGKALLRTGVVPSIFD